MPYVPPNPVRSHANVPSGQPLGTENPAQAQAVNQPRLTSDVLLDIAQGPANTSFWPLAHTSRALRSLLLTPAAMQRSLKASGHPNHALPPAHASVPAPKLEGMLKRHYAMSRLLAENGNEPVQLPGPVLKLEPNSNRTNRYRLAQQNIFLVENERREERGPMATTTSEGTYLHVARLPKRGELTWNTCAKLAYPSSFVTCSQSGSWLLFARGCDRPLDDNGMWAEHFDAYMCAGLVGNGSRLHPGFSYRLPTNRRPIVNRDGTIAHVIKNEPGSMQIGRLELREGGPHLSEFVVDGALGFPVGQFLRCGNLFFSVNADFTLHVIFDLRRMQIRHTAPYSDYESAFPTAPGGDNDATIEPNFSFDSNWWILRKGSQAVVFNISASGTMDSKQLLKDVAVENLLLRGTDVATQAKFKTELSDFSELDGPSLSLKVANDLYLYVQRAANASDETLLLTRSPMEKAWLVNDPDRLRFEPFEDDLIPEEQ